jgi:photosystem II stability/assembly factor-like uncharacterized protein
MKKIILLFCFLTISVQAQDLWSEYATGQPVANTGINSISIVDDGVTWLNMICGTTNCTPIRRFSKTIDFGATWQTGVVDLGVNSTNLRINNISGISATEAFVAVSPAAIATLGGIWKTSDEGVTWVKQETAAFSDPASFPRQVHFWNTNQGVAFGDATNGYFEIYITSNGGNLWTRAPSSPALIPIDNEEYLITNNFTVTGNTIWAMTYYGRILKSTDFGMNWTISQSPISSFFADFGIYSADLAFTDQNYGLLQTSDFELYSTNDGGTTWNTVDYSGVSRALGISAVPGIANTYIAVGEDSNLVRGSSYTNDGGFNWININDNPDLSYVNGEVIEMRSSLTGFASSYSTAPTVGGIFKWNFNCLCIGLSDFSKNKSIIASPNPTLGRMNISGTNITEIKVFDLLGKQMLISQYQEVSNATVNLESLEDGIYFLSVSNKKGTSTIKVVKQ